MNRHVRHKGKFRTVLVVCVGAINSLVLNFVSVRTTEGDRHLSARGAGVVPAGAGNPSRDDNIDGSADDQDQQAKDSDIDEASSNDTESDNDKERDHDMERDNDKDSVIDNESDHDMERENDEDNNLDAESHMFVWCSTNNMWVKQNVHDGSFDDLEYDLIQHTVHNVYQYVFIKPADFTTMLLTMSTEPLCFALCHNSNDGTNYAIA